MWLLWCWGNFLLFLDYCIFLSWKSIGICQVLFLHQFRWSCFFLFILLMSCITLIFLCWTTLAVWDKSTWSWYIIFFNMLLNLICYYFVEDFCSIFIRDTGLFFLITSVRIWYQSNAGLIKWARTYSLLFNF